MKNTIVTGAAAIALAAPTFAGEEVVTSKTVIEPAAATCDLGLSGDISLGWQSDYLFRGLTGATLRKRDGGAEDSMNAQLNLEYAFNSNWSLVSSATVRSGMEHPNSVGHDSFSIGGLWHNDMFSVEAGYQYHNTSYAPNSDEFYANLGVVGPWCGIEYNLFFASGLDSTEILGGQYLELNGKKSWELTSCLSFDLTAGISYSFDYWNGSSDKWNNYYVTAATPFQVAENFSFVPYVTFTDGLSAMYPVGGVTGQNQEDQWIFGLKAILTF